METTNETVLTFQKLREQLEAKREAGRQQFIAVINNAILNLEAIGFHYELVEKNGAAPKRLGRPRKESQNGAQMVAPGHVPKAP